MTMLIVFLDMWFDFAIRRPSHVRCLLCMWTAPGNLRRVERTDISKVSKLYDLLTGAEPVSLV